MKLRWNWSLGLVLGMLAASWTLDAQSQGFGGGAAGGARGGGAGGARSGTATQRTYYGNGQVGDAVITSDPETRRIIVITDEETSRYVSQVVTNLDKPRPQVLIKVVFLQVKYRNTLDVGIEGSYKKKLNSTTTGTFSNLFGLSALGAGATPPGAGLYQVLGNDFQATLRAIAEADKTEVLSRPSILARNNQQASITVGQRIPLVTNVRYDTVGGQINTVAYQDVGILLKVTPFISSDGLVEMIISPEISDLDAQKVSISSGVTAPVINTRSADTVVVTPDGQTVVIGGLMENSKVSSDGKIPILGDIPGLGMLFKRHTKDNSKTELLIFLTPHIVKDPSQLAGLTAEEQNEMDIQKKAFSEKELNRFLEGLPANPKPKK